MELLLGGATAAADAPPALPPPPDIVEFDEEFDFCVRPEEIIEITFF